MSIVQTVIVLSIFCYRFGVCEDLVIPKSILAPRKLLDCRTIPHGQTSHTFCLWQYSLSGELSQAYERRFDAGKELKSPLTGKMKESEVAFALVDSTGENLEQGKVVLFTYIENGLRYALWGSVVWQPSWDAPKVVIVGADPGQVLAPYVYNVDLTRSVADFPLEVDWLNQDALPPADPPMSAPHIWATFLPPAQKFSGACNVPWISISAGRNSILIVAERPEKPDVSFSADCPTVVLSYDLKTGRWMLSPFRSVDPVRIAVVPDYIVEGAPASAMVLPLDSNGIRRVELVMNGKTIVGGHGGKYYGFDFDIPMGLKTLTLGGKITYEDGRTYEAKQVTIPVKPREEK